MIGEVDAETFMVRLMAGVIGSACVVFFCSTCYKVRRHSLDALAKLRRQAEHEARLSEVYVCDNYQDEAHWAEHGITTQSHAAAAQSRAKTSEGKHVPHEQHLHPVGRGGLGCIKRGALEGGRRSCLFGGAAGPKGSRRESLFQRSRRPSDRFSSSRSSAGDSDSTEPAKPPPVPLIRWGHGMTLSGPPGPSLAEVAGVEVPIDDEPTKHRSTRVDVNRFASEPLAVLATGDARVATIKPLRRCSTLQICICTCM